MTERVPSKNMKKVSLGPKHIKKMMAPIRGKCYFLGPKLHDLLPFETPGVQHGFRPLKCPLKVPPRTPKTLGPISLDFSTWNTP